MLPDKPFDCSTHVLHVRHQLIDPSGELRIYMRNQGLRSGDARFFALQSLSFEVPELKEGQLGPPEDLLVFVLPQGGRPYRLFAGICRCGGSNSHEFLKIFLLDLDRCLI